MPRGIYHSIRVRGIYIYIYINKIQKQTKVVSMTYNGSTMINFHADISSLASSLIGYIYIYPILMFLLAFASTRDRRTHVALPQAQTIALLLNSTRYLALGCTEYRGAISPYQQRHLDTPTIIYIYIYIYI
jgi:hypothetical protein